MPHPCLKTNEPCEWERLHALACARADELQALMAAQRAESDARLARLCEERNALARERDELRTAGPAIDETRARVDRINADDAAAAKVGAMLADALHLRRDATHRDRWRTTWGTKTDAGLARTILRMALDALPA